MNNMANSIETFRDEDGFFRLGDLTDAQRSKLFAELGELDETAVAFVIAGIERTLHNFVATLEFLNTQGSKGVERFKALGACDAFIQLEKALDNLGPAGIEDMLEVSEVEDEHDFIKFREELSFWSKEVADFANSVEVQRGRRPLEEFDEAVIDLAALYEHVTGKRAALPSTYLGSLEGNAQSLHGPFARFCTSVMEIVAKSEHSTVLNAIRRVLDRRN